MDKNQKIKKIIRPSLRDQVYEGLKSAIMTLEFQPGERLHDHQLAEDFGVSRTPVREALKRLEDEGLVESSPGSSTKVAPLYSEEAKHTFVVVAALQALAARLAFPFIGEEEIKELSDANKNFKCRMRERDARGAIEEDYHFHNVFVRASKNPEIEKMLARLIGNVYRLELSKFSSVEGESSYRDHQEIIEAVQKGEKEKVEKLVEKNWLTLGDKLAR
ncbi:GntR family transcriptional regulator [Bacillus endophyticus]|uniref:GntR family transcriptional regulator n=1 Tax=Priestia endophytica TaxID=135735 RepID=UPI0018CE3176|nr:GntR family transcriptional regulator [Priestia endophytica]MBG9813981.1 GntR family transcriptional regulator [Priestia endophytica]